MDDSQEAEHSAQPSLVFHTTMAKPEGNEETPRTSARDHQQAAKRKDVKQIIADLTPLLRGHTPKRHGLKGDAMATGQPADTAPSSTND